MQDFVHQQYHWIGHFERMVLQDENSLFRPAWVSMYSLLPWLNRFHDFHEWRGSWYTNKHSYMFMLNAPIYPSWSKNLHVTKIWSIPKLYFICFIMSHAEARHAQFEISWVNSNPYFNGSFQPGQSKWMYFGVCAGPQMFRICLPLLQEISGTLNRKHPHVLKQVSSHPLRFGNEASSWGCVGLCWSGFATRLALPLKVGNVAYMAGTLEERSRARQSELASVAWWYRRIGEPQNQFKVAQRLGMIVRCFEFEDCSWGQEVLCACLCVCSSLDLQCFCDGYSE